MKLNRQNCPTFKKYTSSFKGTLVWCDNRWQECDTFMHSLQRGETPSFVHRLPGPLPRPPDILSEFVKVFYNLFDLIPDNCQYWRSRSLWPYFLRWNCSASQNNQTVGVWWSSQVAPVKRENGRSIPRFFVLPDSSAIGQHRCGPHRYFSRISLEVPVLTSRLRFVSWTQFHSRQRRRRIHLLWFGYPFSCKGT